MIDKKNGVCKGKSKDYNTILSRKQRSLSFLSIFFHLFVVNYIWRKNISGGWMCFMFVYFSSCDIWDILYVNAERTRKFVFFKFNIFSMAHIWYQLWNGDDDDPKEILHDKCWLSKAKCGSVRQSFFNVHSNRTIRRMFVRSLKFRFSFKLVSVVININIYQKTARWSRRFYCKIKKAKYVTTPQTLSSIQQTISFNKSLHTK